MLKKSLKYSLISLLSVLFIYAACGYNLAKYCCSTCEAEGLQAIIEEPCHQTHASDCCTTNHEEENDTAEKACTSGKCELVHLKVDDSIIHSEKPNTSNNETNFVLLFALAELFQTNDYTLYLGNSLDPPEKPIPLAGRTMLSSICILRI